MHTPSKSAVRFAVVGLGHFGQTAVLPAFANAKEKATLAALFTGDAEKAHELSAKYQVKAHSYDAYDRLLAAGDIDAVYIALPNAQHRDYTERAARAGVHVLCEKPLAATVEDAAAMVEACERQGIKLMTAYRLHFEEGNLQAIKVVQSGRLGLPRVFTSIHSSQVEAGNTRLDASLGGGPLEDIGIYSINAARYLFQAEPFEASAFAVHGGDAAVSRRSPGDVHLQFRRGEPFGISCHRRRRHADDESGLYLARRHSTENRREGA